MERLRNKRKTETPLRRCHRCNGSGMAPCTTCGGTGKLLKGRTAQGAPEFSRCEGCFGRKTSRCPTCHGQRFI